MAYKSKDIEDYAIKSVIKFEKRDGWIAKDVRRKGKEYNGYDVLSQKNGKKRYIEVKSGSKDAIWTNVMVHSTAKSLLKKGELWIYCVLNVKKAIKNKDMTLTKFYITKPNELKYEPITKFQITKLNKEFTKWK